MCGLVGVAAATVLTTVERDMFTDLLYIDTLRGHQSTGVFCVNKTGQLQLYKKAIEGFDFVTMRKYEELFVKPHNLQILAGHNRQATKGIVKAANAHPFHQGDICLMHNGTLRGFDGLTKHTEFDTDSEAIAYNLSLVPPEDARQVIENLNGAFALVWYDMRDATLNVIRNAERPLYVGTDDPAKPLHFAWASEAEMLSIAARSSKATLFKSVESFKIMHHYKLSLADNKITLVNCNPYKEYVVKYTAHHGNSLSGSGGSYAHRSSRYASQYNNISTSGSTAPYTSGVTSRKKEVVHTAPKHFPKVGEVIEVIPSVFVPYQVQYGAIQSGNDAGHIMCVAYRTDRFNKGVEVPVALHNKTRKEYMSYVDKNVTLSVKIGRTQFWNKRHECTAEVVGVNEVPVSKKPLLALLPSHIESPKSKEKPPLKSLSEMYDQAGNLGLDEALLFLPGPNRTLLSVKEWNRATAYGCSLCQCNLSPSQADDLEWVNEYTVLCPSCNLDNNRVFV